MKNQRSPLRSISLGLAVVAGLVIYAYGFNVIKLDFSETRSERRLNSLTRILRALTHPDLITYEYQETDVETPIYLPCPEGDIEQAPQTDQPGPFITTSVPCAGPGEILQVEGYRFQPNSSGSIYFIAASGVKFQRGEFRADEDGQFLVEIDLPNRQPVEEAQYIRATGRVRVGSPQISDTARITLDKIIETVFLALIATTFGTILAIPISFISARNLMSEVKSPLTSAAFSVLGWPVGIYIGLNLNRWFTSLTQFATTSAALNLAGVVISFAIAIILARWSLPPAETEAPSPQKRALRMLGLALVGASSIILLQTLSLLTQRFGESLVEPLGPFGFIGSFLSQMGDLLRMVTPIVVALIVGGVLGNTLGSIGQQISDRANASIVKIVNVIFASLAGGLLLTIIGVGINWFYQFDDPTRIYLILAAIGGALGFLLALRFAPKQTLPTGTTIYFLMRTLLNATRSVEPLVMVIVFVVWVGIGPFAGSLALALHTIAALAKLYSEQVESILPGPLEAIRATGANRLQMIIYAVVPQIVPPYISFTMYRWDINVRMSTIIGFAGGGGIGFLLQQNINLLDYRAASVQMLAIAIVVATMDFVSSTLRERFV